MNANPIPKLNDWEPNESDVIFEIIPNANKIRAVLSKCKSLENAPDELKEKLMLLSTFSIRWKHYMVRMPDITKAINYFITFYDEDDEYMLALMSLKYHVDSDRCKDVSTFQTLLLHIMITDSLTEKIRKMIRELEPANIESEKTTSYKSTPKLTNEDAENILLLSFYFRFILPIVIHWYNLPSTEGIANEKNYIQTFVCIFKSVVEKIGKGAINVYILIKQLINHRIGKKFNSDIIIHEKKKEKNGTTDASYCNELSDEILLVKSLYKIDYSKSVVSYIDGIIGQNYMQYKVENFKIKTVGISTEEITKDSDDSFSHLESIEMKTYRVNDGNNIIENANIELALNRIDTRFNIKISNEQLDWYNEHIGIINPLAKYFVTYFYQNFFGESSFIDLLDRRTTIKLILIMKFFLELKGFKIIPQVCTASMVIEKESAIKNRKFNDKFENSQINNEIMTNKFSYIKEIIGKDDIIKKYVSSIINSTFTLVDESEKLNGLVCSNLKQDDVIDEFCQFLLINI
jgi:hypothetical protein